MPKYFKMCFLVRYQYSKLQSATVILQFYGFLTWLNNEIKTIYIPGVQSQFSKFDSAKR